MKEIILYIVFGILTTVINILAFFGLYEVFDVDIILANVLAWIISVIFAYLTNRRFVFVSKRENFIREMSLFFIARLSSLLLDTIIVYIGIKTLAIHALIVKVIANVIVVIFNYVVSKFIIFKKRSL